MQYILFATQSYFDMEVKPYYFMTRIYSKTYWFIHGLFIMKSRKNLSNTLVISRKFKHNQNHKAIIWERNTLKQNNILIESFQVMKNLARLMTLFSIRWPMSCYSK